MRRMGPLEIKILGAIASLTAQGVDEIYGRPIRLEVERRTGSPMTYNPLYVTLNRLEARGMISTKPGGRTAIRGGREKRLVTISADGLRALKEAREEAAATFDFALQT